MVYNLATMSSSTQQHRQAAPTHLRFSVLTISDTRTLETDHSGQLLCSSLTEAGHQLVERQIVPDEAELIAGRVCQLCAAQDLDSLLLTGGTGISPRDRTPEAVRPLLDLELTGFGELFRSLSYAEIGPAAMLSRAFAGRRGGVLIFCLPGSRNAVQLAIDKILLPELPHLVHHSRG